MSLAQRRLSGNVCWVRIGSLDFHRHTHTRRSVDSDGTHIDTGAEADMQSVSQQMLPEPHPWMLPWAGCPVYTAQTKSAPGPPSWNSAQQKSCALRVSDKSFNSPNKELWDLTLARGEGGGAEGNRVGSQSCKNCHYSTLLIMSQVLVKVLYVVCFIR